MSDVYPVSLVVFHPRDIRAVFSAEESKLLSGADCEEPSNCGKWGCATRSFHGLSHGDNLTRMFGGLLASAPARDLEFLFRGSCTHKFEDVSEELRALPLEQRPSGSYWQVREHTLIRDDSYNSVLGQITLLRKWCLANPLSCANVDGGHTEEEMLRIIEDAYVCDDLNDDAPWDEGDTWEALFCTLCTLENRLKYGRARRLWAVYTNSYIDGVD